MPAVRLDYRSYTSKEGRPVAFCEELSHHRPIHQSHDISVQRRVIAGIEMDNPCTIPISKTFRSMIDKNDETSIGPEEPIGPADSCCLQQKEDNDNYKPLPVSFPDATKRVATAIPLDATTTAKCRPTTAKSRSPTKSGQFNQHPFTMDVDLIERPKPSLVVPGKKKSTTARRKQERLLWLHHSAGCTKKECHCAAGKRLWEHMELCNDDKCSVKHCHSSRLILAHFSRCKNEKCPICPPVRRAISKKEAQSVEHRPRPTTSKSRGLFSFSR